LIYGVEEEEEKQEESIVTDIAGLSWTCSRKAHLPRAWNLPVASHLMSFTRDAAGVVSKTNEMKAANI